MSWTTCQSPIYCLMSQLPFVKDGGRAQEALGALRQQHSWGGPEVCSEGRGSGPWSWLCLL